VDPKQTMGAIWITLLVCIFVIIAVAILICQCKGGNRKKRGTNDSAVDVGRERRPKILGGRTYSDGAAAAQATHGGVDDGGAAMLVGAALAAAAADGGAGGV